MKREDLTKISLEELYEELNEIKKNAKIATKHKYHEKAIYYYDMPCGFDTETTSTEIDGRKVAWVYEYTFGIGDHIYLMRTIDEFLQILDMVQLVFGLDESHRVVCYVHNLGFDYQFIKHYIEWGDVFGKDELHPIYAISNYGVEFRDMEILAGNESLAEVAKHLNNHKIEKLKGDLDYTKIRHAMTPLNKKEWGYCINDVKIILYYIEEQIAEYGDITHVPLTDTGRVREYCKNHCLYVVDENGEIKRNAKSGYVRNADYHHLMKLETLNDEIKRWLDYEKAGGLVTANALWADTKLYDVSCIDYTSAYINFLIKEEYPFGEPVKYTFKDKNELLDIIQNSNRACLFYFEFINIRVKEDAACSYLSWRPDKMPVGENVKNNDNNHITSADRLGLYMNEIDFNIISRFYEWDDIDTQYCNYLYMWLKAPLPVELVKCMLKLYKDKTELKGVEDSKMEYLRKKGMLNSIYGMMVQDYLKNTKLKVGDLNESTNRFTYYPWGCWVTAYCRQGITSAIEKAGVERFVYTDTDSMYYFEDDDMKQWVEDYNENNFKELKKAMDFYNLPIEMIAPLNKDGEEIRLGNFTHEGTYKNFKTLGAKRKMLLTDHSRPTRIRTHFKPVYVGRVKYELSVSGLPKAAMDYFKSFTDPFEAFNGECIVPVEHAHKLRYNLMTEPFNGFVRDYQNAGFQVSQLSGVNLEPVRFSMRETDDFIEWMQEMQIKFNKEK